MLRSCNRMLVAGTNKPAFSPSHAADMCTAEGFIVTEVLVAPPTSSQG